MATNKTIKSQVPVSVNNTKPPNGFLIKTKYRLFPAVYLICSSFSGTSWPHQHHSMPYFHRLVELDDFCDLRGYYLQTFFCDHILNLVLEASIVVLRYFHTRKQI